MHRRHAAFPARYRSPGDRARPALRWRGRLPECPTRLADRLDLVTFAQNAGPIPGRPAAEPWADWDTPASRGWTARLLWQAYQAHFGTNHLP